MVRTPHRRQCKITGAHQSSHINSLFSKRVEFLDPRQDGTNASVGREIMLAKDDTSVELMSHI
jgi:hypothetical protein